MGKKLTSKIQFVNKMLHKYFLLTFKKKRKKMPPPPIKNYQKYVYPQINEQGLALKSEQFPKKFHSKSEGGLVFGENS